MMKRISWGYDAHIGRADTGLHSGFADLCGREAGGGGGAGAEDSRREAGVERESAGAFAEGDGGGEAGAGRCELVSGWGKQAAAGSAGAAVWREGGRNFCGIGIERDY